MGKDDVTPYSERGLQLVKLAYMSVAADRADVPISKLKLWADDKKYTIVFQRIWGLCYRSQLAPVEFFELLWPKLIKTVKSSWKGKVVPPTMFAGSFAEDEVSTYLGSNRAESIYSTSLLNSINDSIYQVQVLANDFKRSMTRQEVVVEYAGILAPAFLAWMVEEKVLRFEDIPEDLVHFVEKSIPEVKKVYRSFCTKLDDPDFVKWLKRR